VRQTTTTVHARVGVWLSDEMQQRQRSPADDDVLVFPN